MKILSENTETMITILDNFLSLVRFLQHSFNSKLLDTLANTAAPTDPLADLKDIHLPEEPGVWPLAIGWWFLLAIIIGLTAFAVYVFIRNRRRNQYRKLALTLLDEIQKKYTNDNTSSTLSAIAQLIKRTAQAAGTSPTSASSEHWCHWLNNTTSKPVFSTESLELLSQGQYKPVIENDLTHLLVQTRQWIKQHNLSRVNKKVSTTKQESRHV